MKKNTSIFSYRSLKFQETRQASYKAEMNVESRQEIHGKYPRTYGQLGIKFPSAPLMGRSMGTLGIFI